MQMRKSVLLILGLSVAVVANPRLLHSQTDAEIDSIELDYRLYQISIGARVVVVIGQVMSVRSATHLENILSEHDPLWAVAEVKVNEILYNASDKTVIPADVLFVYFSTNKDIAWFMSPKLAAGQKGILLLGLDELPLKSLPGLYAYNILVPATFQPMDKREYIIQRLP